MNVRHLLLTGFRNHEHTEIECAPGINLFLGNNGEGKTNTLEALSYLCLTKSFFGSNDTTVLQTGKNSFEVGGTLRSDAGTDYRVRALFDQQEGKKEFLINTSPVERFSGVIGLFPVVILSPESAAITGGAPAERRKFLDFVISQSSKRYLEDLLEYRRILRQRNKILLDAKIGRSDPSRLLEPWNEELIDRGAKISLKRKTFAREFSPHVVEVYEALAGTGESPTMRYHPSVPVDESGTETETKERFRKQLEQTRADERRSGTTMAGPHRDDIEFTVNNMTLKHFASQGQHKTVQISLKIAEYRYLREYCRETPILLLDDVFSELDHDRAGRLLNTLKQMGQVFISATGDEMARDRLTWEANNRRFFVQQGAVQRELIADS